MDQKLLQWHPAFQAVLQIELLDERDSLKFQREFNLSEKPLQIDTLIIKSEPEKRTIKTIGHLFRRHNIIEYKSPGDYLSVNDFYKVLAYACIYQSNTKTELEIRPEELTITMVTNHYPRKLIRHLSRLYKSVVKEQYPGIYYADGLMFPVQIILIGRLSPEEYVWLSRLRRDLSIMEDIEPLSKEYKGKEKNPLFEAAMDIIVRANWPKYKEGRDMCNALEELFADKLVEWEKKGIEKGFEEGIEKGIEKGKAEAIIELLSDLGPVSEALREKIFVQENPKILTAWLKLAAKAENLEGFKNQMNGE